MNPAMNRPCWLKPGEKHPQKVFIGETVDGLSGTTETVEINGRMITRPVTRRRTERVIPYSEHEYRCRVCCPGKHEGI